MDSATPYEPKLVATAEEDLRKLPLSLRQEVYSHLARLAVAPTRLSRPSATPPHPPGFQVSEFLCEEAGEWRLLTIFFKYGADEQTLLIYFIGHVNYGARRPESWPEE